LEPLPDRRHVAEEVERFGDSQVEDVRDRASLELHLERLPVEAAATTDLAGDEHVGEEVHLDGDEAVAAARLAAAALHVEGEPTRTVATRARLGELREQLADRREHTGVGGGIRAWAASDRRLVHLDHLVDQLPADQLVVRARLLPTEAELPRERTVERVD